MRLSLVTAPASEPITFAEAKLHVKVESSVTADDALITSLIVAARGKVETDAQRQLITATWKAILDRFPNNDTEVIELPLPPLQSVSSVQYVDTAGALQTWAASNYIVEASAGPWAREGRLAPAISQSYPDAGVVPEAVRVQFIAGYGAATSVPQELKQAMYLLIGHWYEHREAVRLGEVPASVPFAYEALIQAFQRLTAAMA